MSGELLEVTVPEDFLSSVIENLPRQFDPQIERALDELAAAALQNIRVNFLIERDPEGNPWIPSKAGTLRKLNRKGRTLFDTGRLFHSIQLFDSGPGERHIGTDVSYAGFLQGGTKFMPARPFIGFPKLFEETAVNLFEKRVFEEL